MSDWWTIGGMVLAGFAGLVSLVSGIRGREPRDLTVLATAAIEIWLFVGVVAAIALPLSGQGPTGDLVEFWMYLGTALLMPPLVIVWALVDRTRFGTIAMGAVSIAIVVMILRMSVIWG